MDGTIAQRTVMDLRKIVSFGEYDLRGVLILVAAGLLGHRLLQLVYNVFLHPLAKIPGPLSRSASRLPLAWSISRGLHVRHTSRLHARYGPIVRTAPNAVSLAHEGSWADVFQGSDQRFLKDETWWGDQPGLPTSIVTAIEPGLHRRIRKSIAPGFGADASKGQEKTVMEYADLLVEKLRGLCSSSSSLLSSSFEKGGAAAVVNVTPWFNYATFDIFGAVFFGSSFGCLESSRYHPWIALLFDSVKMAAFVAAARLFPIGEFILFHCIPRAFLKVQRDHYQHIADRVQGLLNTDAKQSDIMAHVIQRGEENGLSMPVINSTYMILTIAGSETSATILAGTLNCLVRRPETLEILTREVRSAFAGLEDIHAEALKALPYLDAVLKEGLRMCPPVPLMLPRRVPKGGEVVCGTWLPGGTSVTVASQTMNYSRDFFHDPLSFLPERWLLSNEDPDSPFRHDKRQALQPFSVGPRACIGKAMAWMEMRIILSKLVWAFDMRAGEEGSFAWEDLRTFVLVEKKPVEVVFSPRAVGSEMH